MFLFLKEEHKMIIFRVKLKSDWQEREEEDFFTDPMLASMHFVAILEEEVADLISSETDEEEKEKLRNWLEDKNFELSQIEDEEEVLVNIKDTDIYLSFEKLWLEN